MGTGDTNGLATALALAGGAGDVDDDGQDALFELGQLPLAGRAPGKSGPQGGRPAGRRNKSTEWWRERFLTRFESPLIGLGEIYARTAQQLAEELFLTRTVSELAPGQQSLKTVYRLSEEGGSTVTKYLVWDLERAMRIQLDCMREALPYVHQKQPLALAVKNSLAGLGVLVMGELGGAGSDAGGFGLAAVPMQQNQDVIDVEPEKSDGEKVGRLEKASDASGLAYSDD